MGLMILAAAYHLMFQTIFAAAEGEKVVTEAQLARAVLNLMAADVRSALSGEGAERPHFLGARDRLSVCTARVHGDLSLNAETASQATDVVQVTYSVGGGGEGATGATLVREQRPATQDSTAAADEPDAADMGDTDAATPARPVRRVLARGLAGVGIRYSDGGAWQEDWDSRRDGGPPRAVEITMAFVDAIPDDPDQPEPDTLFASEEAARTYRLVVFVPTGGRPEDPARGFGRPKTGVERHMEQAFTQKWREMTGGLDRELKRSRMPSARSSGRATKTTTQAPAGAEPERKTRAGAWGLRPMD